MPSTEAFSGHHVVDNLSHHPGPIYGVHRRESNLDRERERLAERREWLEDEWYELEQIRMKLEEREEALDAAANSVSDIGSFAQRALSDKYPETRGPP